MMYLIFGERVGRAGRKAETEARNRAPVPGRRVERHDIEALLLDELTGMPPLAA